MVSPNVNKIMQEVNSLSDPERQELWRLLENRSNGNSALTKEQKLRDALVQRGLLEKQSLRSKDIERYRQWQPVVVEGKPLSQTIIEERR